MNLQTNLMHAEKEISCNSEAMENSNLWSLTITDAALALDAGTVTSRHLTEAVLERIASLDPALHAYTRLTPDLALADADRADADRNEGRLTGPLQGIPIAVKDAIDDPDAPATFGNPALHSAHPGGSSTVMTRLCAAGAVRLGKLTLSEGVWVEHHASVPPPLNPYGPDHWTGTSSSGSGVALTAGLTFGSIGTDTGGSIRLPSGCCGVTGLKPTWGRISTFGVHPLSPAFDTVGPMARTARDVALLMDAVAGHDSRDPTSLSAPIAPCRVGGPQDLHGLRLGLPTREIAISDLAVQDAVAEAVQVFRRLGAQIVEISLPDPEPVIGAWSVISSAEAAALHRDSYLAHADIYGKALTDLILRGQNRTSAQIADAKVQVRRHREQMAAAFSGVDAVLLPALPVGGPSNAFMGSFASDEASTQVIGRYTVPFSTSGFPTLTVPCGRSSAGIPIGLQICGAPMSEALLCSIGAAFQDVTLWHGVADI
ncbi:amidase [Salipiger sp. 1_MG-2023]|uniref:amidase n=1 Tax=Salipiger sp. 1_MG-2023 TaxID=3062665 RepID=UPI0026E2FA51|nr:amidase [Salipiger sp. 1_MG-2023]MDO6588139.1 amidase [Salipiger sp. 1_MG-2023]